MQKKKKKKRDIMQRHIKVVIYFIAVSHMVRKDIIDRGPSVDIMLQRLLKSLILTSVFNYM